MRNAGVVPRFGPFGVTHQKANCAAVKGRCRLAIDGFGDHETAAIVRVSQAASSVLNARWSAHCEVKLRPALLLSRCQHVMDSRHPADEGIDSLGISVP